MMSGLIWVHIVCKNCKQTAKVAASEERVNCWLSALESKPAEEKGVICCAKNGWSNMD